jgi:hypothetical protein
MSSFLSGALTGTAGGLAGSAITSVIQKIFVNPRSIGGFTADVTIEERHEDTLVVTQHPVEQGSTITDHAYKQPAKVTIRCGWSNASLNALLGMAEALIDGSFSFNADYVQTTYNKFLDLQNSRVLFDVLTGKRKYKNMLITRLSVVTDATSEYALMMTCECQEIFLATTQTVEVNQTQNGGTKSLQPAPKYNSATPS